MEKLHKEPGTYSKDYNAFVCELKQFHLNRGTQFRNVPRINGREIDLYSLYNEVTALGGWQKVNDGQKWNIVLDSLKLPKGCVNSSLALRQIYIRYLGHYEKIHYHGEDPDEDTGTSSESRSRKQHNTMLHLVPMVYNLAQHEISDSARQSLGLSQQFVTPTDYDKLCLSLLSGLPNEQEFALNVCTILSNEGNHVLHLDQIPRLVDLLLAQAGIWPEGDLLLRNLYKECWENLKGRNMNQFWLSILDCSNPDILKLYGAENGNDYNEDFLFKLDEEFGCRNSEGQRVLRIGLILYNLSFEKYNVPVLAKNSNFLRFLLLCIHSNWLYLKHIALDTLGNLAGHISLSLEKSLCSKIMLRTMSDGIQSSDRYMVIRCMEILSQLCQCTQNEDILPSKLDYEVYEKMVSLLTVRDVMLLVYTLEALYNLSDLGRYASERIVRVHRSVGSLVSLLTLDPQQYGAEAQMGMKLVETFVPAEITDSDPTPATPPPAAKSEKGSHSPGAHGNSEVDSETLVSTWLRTTYEIVPGNSVSRNDIYADYVNYCSKAGRKGVVNANVFANCVRSVFPKSALKKVESATGTITFHHDSLKRKKAIGSPCSSQGGAHKGSANIPVASRPSANSSSTPVRNPSHSPILKAQLSAPPRPLSSPPQQKLHQTLASHSVSPSPPPSPHYPSPSTTPTPSSTYQQPSSPGSSTLIKTLLASKVTRNLQRQQQQLLQQQGVTKVILHSTPGQNKKQLTSHNSATPTSTASRNLQHIKPASPASKQALSTWSAANKGKLISSAATTLTSRMNRNSPGLIQSGKSNKSRPGTVAAAAARLNGVQRDVQLEVCSQAEEARNLVDNPTSQEAHIKRIQNHLTHEKLFVVADSNDSMQTSDGESVVSLRESAFSSDSEQNSSSSLYFDSSIPSTKQFSEFTPSISGGVLVTNTTTTTSSSSNNNITNSGLIFSRSKSCPLGESTFSISDQKIATGSSHVNIISTSATALNQKSLSSSKVGSATNLQKSILSEIDSKKDEEALKQKANKEKIYKRSPLLNGLLDRGKIPLSKEKNFHPTTTIVQNGNRFGNNSGTKELAIPDSKIAVTSLISTTCQSTSQPTIKYANAQLALSGSNNSNISQSSEQVLTLKFGVESPENSNTGSDLSSISDIARTLECASKAISRTNAECHSALPAGTAVTTTTTSTTTSIAAAISSSGVTSTTQALTRPGQQIIVVTPALNQTQLHIQSSNIKIRLHNITKLDEHIDLIGLPRVSLNQLNQLRQQQQQPIEIPSTALKRPSSDHPSTLAVVDTKRPRQESKTPLLEATLRSPVPTPVPIAVVTTVTNTNVEDSKSFQDTRQLPVKLQSGAEQTSSIKLSTVKTAVTLGQNLDSHIEKSTELLGGISQNVESPPTASHHGKHTLPGTKLEFICEWKDCLRTFSTPLSVFLHATKVHAPIHIEDTVCLWENCDGMKRKRFSLLTHLQDWHCNERILQIQAIRRQQVAQQGKTSIPAPQQPPPHPGYAPDAALLAIRRHALQYLNPKEMAEEKEGPLTKSIRLTSALVLRNLVTHSSLARSYVRRYEPELAYLAMSSIESSRTIAQCLSELSRPHE